MRPESIRKFEQFYLVSIALAVVNLLMSQSQASSALSSVSGGLDYVPGASGVVASLFAASLAFGLLFALLIPLALWYFAARRANQVARWVAIGLGALSAVRLLFLLCLLAWLFVSPFSMGGWFLDSMLLGALSEGLHMVALYYLFLPDARAWFERSNAAARHQDIFS